MDSDQLFKMFSPVVLENALWFETIKNADSVTTAVVHLRFRILGGKGGFGSQLRAQGNKMSSKKRAGDYSSCRDLTGRRIRTTEQNQKIEEHLRAVPEYQSFLADRKKSKAEAMLKEGSSKLDNDFVSKHHESTEMIESIVTESFTSKQRMHECEKDAKNCKSPIIPWLE